LPKQPVQKASFSCMGKGLVFNNICKSRRVVKNLQVAGYF
jgi:hypothetical protein